VTTSPSAVSRGRRATLRWFVPASIFTAALVLAVVSARKGKRQSLGTVPPRSPDLSSYGLSESEALARTVEGSDNAIAFKPPPSRRAIIRASALTILNVSILAIALVQVILERPVDALITMGMLVVSIGVNILQWEFVRVRLRGMRRAARPTATAVRDGQLRAVDTANLVSGDALVIGRGDVVLADGHLVGPGRPILDESLLTGHGARTEKSQGDLVYAGSFCLRGQGIYIADTLGVDRRVVRQLRQAEQMGLQLTPIERVVKRVLTAVLALVLVIASAAIISYLRLDPTDSTDAFINAMSVLLSLAPASLFFMVVLTYAASTADISKVGALVPRARCVEVLANVDVICFSHESLLTGTRIDVSPAPGPSGQEAFSAHRLRQTLGDYAQSTLPSGALGGLLRSNLDGNRRSVVAEMPFITAYGWSGAVFDDPDLRGVFVIGEPEILEPALAGPAPGLPADPAEESRSIRARARRQMSRVVGPIVRLTQRGRDDTLDRDREAKRDDEAGDVGPVPVSPKNGPIESPDDDRPEQTATGNGWRRRPLFRLRGRIPSLGGRADVPSDAGTEGDQRPDPETQLILAHIPQPASLFDSAGRPTLPAGLIRLGTVELRRQARPEAVEATKAFVSQGIDVKILSSDPARDVVRTLIDAGVPVELARTDRAIECEVLTGMTDAELSTAARDHSVFGGLNPEQGASIVRSLREAGHTVAVLGDSISDITTMGQADLTLVRQRSAPATLTLADMILVDDSPVVVPRLIERGQRIVNGLLDVLKLYVSQVFYALGLIVMVRLFSRGFPYTSSEGTMVGVFALAIPATALSIWAPRGMPSGEDLARNLMTFVIGASIATTAVGFTMYQFFLHSSGTIEYAQTALTHVLIVTGLMLAGFIRPPLRFNGLEPPEILDLRPLVVSVVSGFLFVVTTHIPLAQQLLKVRPLGTLSDYAVIGVAGLGWALVFSFGLQVTQWVAGSGRQTARQIG